MMTILVETCERHIIEGMDNILLDCHKLDTKVNSIRCVECNHSAYLRDNGTIDHEPLHTGTKAWDSYFKELNNELLRLSQGSTDIPEG